MSVRCTLGSRLMDRGGARDEGKTKRGKGSRASASFTEDGLEKVPGLDYIDSCRLVTYACGPFFLSSERNLIIVRVHVVTREKCRYRLQRLGKGPYACPD